MSQIRKTVSWTRRTRLLPVRRDRAANDDGWLQTGLIGPRCSRAGPGRRRRISRLVHIVSPAARAENCFFLAYSKRNRRSFARLRHRRSHAHVTRRDLPHVGPVARFPFLDATRRLSHICDILATSPPGGFTPDAREMVEDALECRDAERRNKTPGFRRLHAEWSNGREYREPYEELQPEFEVARALIAARSRAGLTQAQLAARMNTSQSVVSRLESGQGHPSTKTLERIARATGTRLRIAFETVSDAV